MTKLGSIFILSFFLLFISCANTTTPNKLLQNQYSNLLLTKQDLKASSPQYLTFKEALEDLSIIKHIINRGYSGRDVLAQRGVQWDKLFYHIEKSLMHLKWPMKVETFRHILLNEFQDIPDNHLALYTVDTRGRWNYGSAGFHLDAFTTDLIFTKRALVHTQFLDHIIRI